MVLALLRCKIIPALGGSDGQITSNYVGALICLAVYFGIAVYAQALVISCGDEINYGTALHWHRVTD